MPQNIEFDVRFGRGAAPRRAVEGGPMRLLLLGNFSGRAASTAQPDSPARALKVQPVDVDNLDEVLARIAPTLVLPADDAATELRFSSLDDFHPDRLFERAERFARLRALRARLLDPATFEAAAGELRVQVPASAQTGGAGDSAPVSAAESDSGTLERLLGRDSRGKAELIKSNSVADALIRRVVAPHIARESTPHLRVYLDAVDAGIGEEMRQLLHAPAFKELEAAWRGVQWLTSRLELGEELQLYLLDVTRAELARDLTAQPDPSRSDLARALSAAAAKDGPWTLLVGLFDVGTEDLDLLAGLGSIAAGTQAPLVAAAMPDLFGCSSVADLAEPREWQPLSEEASARWADLRCSAAAPWIGLTAPHILMRLPYGKATDPIERFAFEENPPSPDAGRLLWGPGSLAVALLLGQAFAEGGWDGLANAGQIVDDLPAYTFRKDGETQLQPCAEAWLGERAGEALLACGLMPLLSERQAPRVRLLRMQSIADPPLPLAIGSA
jgi:type VI secretion system protein ImpC